MDNSKDKKTKFDIDNFYGVTDRIREMGNKDHPENIQKLVGYLNKKNKIYHCFWAINSLRIIAHPNAISYLKEFAEITKDPFLRDSAKQTIQEIKEANGVGIFSVKKGIELLRKALKLARYPYGGKKVPVRKERK